MIGFKTFILESSKNTHLEHLEDYIVHSGISGAKSSVSFLEELLNMLRGNSNSSVNISVKWDGAPAVICGINPENNKFFVATKSLFNKEPKINYTNSDITKNHGRGELSDKLKICLKYLSKLGITDIVQGDLLFTSDDLKSAKVDNKEYLVFKPNTITYAVPNGTDISKKISSSKLGIVFHTTYKGTEIKKLTASFGANVSAYINNKNIWVVDSDYSDKTGTVTLTSKEVEYITERISYLQKLISQMNNLRIDKIISDSDIKSYIKMYVNSKIKVGQNISGTKKYANGLVDFIKNIYLDKIKKLKTQRGIESNKQKMEDILKFIDENKNELIQMFLFSATIVDVKSIFLKKLNKINSINTFLETPDGFKVTSPEGFVAVDRIGNAVKLVDRLEFSRANFNFGKF